MSLDSVRLRTQADPETLSGKSQPIAPAPAGDAGPAVPLSSLGVTRNRRLGDQLFHILAWLPDSGIDPGVDGSTQAF